MFLHSFLAFVVAPFPMVTNQFFLCVAATNSNRPLGVNDGQWRNLKKYHDSGGSKSGQRLLAFYLTLTQVKANANVYENTKSEFGARGKWDSLVNDLAKIAITNYQHSWEFANFLMVCGGGV